MVKLLLNDFNARTVINDASNRWEHTPLTRAIRFNGDLEMVKRLVEEGGADKNKVGFGSQTPLELALETKKKQKADYLQNQEKAKSKTLFSFGKSRR